MNGRDSLPSFSVAFGGLVGFSCQDHTTKPQLCYQGRSVQTLHSHCSAYFSQSNADQNNPHPINPLSEFLVTYQTQTVSGSSNELDLTVIPKSILDEYTPWKPGNESVVDELFPTLDSYLSTQSHFSGNEPVIEEPTLANRLNPEHHLTDRPAEPANQEDSRPSAVVNPLNLQQVTNDNPANSAEIVDDKSSQVERRRERERERQRERQRERRKNPAFREREREYQRERRNNPELVERRKEYLKKYRRERRKNPALQERDRVRQRECKRKQRKNPAFLKRERERCKNPEYVKRQREYRRKRRKDAALLERQRDYQRDYMRERRKDPAFLERQREYIRERRKNPT